MMEEELEYDFIPDAVEASTVNVSQEVVDIVSLSNALLELYAAAVVTQNKTFGKDKHIDVLMRALNTATECYSVISKIKTMNSSKADIYVDQVDN